MERAREDTLDTPDEPDLPAESSKPDTPTTPDASTRRVHKREFIRALSRESYMPYHLAERMYEAFLKVLLDHIQNGDTVVLQGFGNFSWRTHRGRKIAWMTEGDTGEPQVTGEYKTILFSPSRELKNYINLDKEQLEKTAPPGLRLMRTEIAQGATVTKASGKKGKVGRPRKQSEPDTPVTTAVPPRKKPGRPKKSGTHTDDAVIE